jgi:hypothetical protein
MISNLLLSNQGPDAKYQLPLLTLLLTPSFSFLQILIFLYNKQGMITNLLLSNQGPDAKYQLQRDLLDDYMRQRKLPLDLRRRIRENIEVNMKGVYFLFVHYL